MINLEEQSSSNTTIGLKCVWNDFVQVQDNCSACHKPGNTEQDAFILFLIKNGEHHCCDCIAEVKYYIA